MEYLTQSSPSEVNFCQQWQDNWTHAQVVGIGFTIAISMLIYALCFILGVNNIYRVLILKKYSRSMFLPLQYVFGQLICIARWVFLISITTIYFKIENEGFCQMS